jgi:Spy/CpxP family protein refolding chaperone
VSVDTLSQDPNKHMNRSILINRLTTASWLVICASCLALTGCNTTKTPETPVTNGTTTTTTTTASSPDPATSTPSATSTPAATAGSDPEKIRPERSASNPLQLLQTAQLKSELKLTDDQVTKIKQVETDTMTSLKTEYDAIMKLPQKDRAAEIEKKVPAKLATLTKESQGKMSAILKPEQEKRAKQIFLQIYGFSIITKDDFATELKLTDAQKKQLNDIGGQTRGKAIAAVETPDKDDATKRDQAVSDNRKRMEAIMKESNQQAKAVLTADQLKTLETLKGKAFPFTMPTPAK